ncbi:hypothetical protein JRQ81_012378 [Phrynocephalus forsythii]|uniref:Death domain-containing protein n=1 Tax=Phrynocephalus forsythii TaxID=171643 RepID=A0A9Q0Y0Z8_9SAUR|nr:hypothetical protein JRQ81_012378 [Phrynocephalus forsythii]
MESLQVDAVAEPPSNAQRDLPGSLHSSQPAGPVEETLFEACPVNEPVESCENSLEPPMTVERKLLEELNYHTYGSRMDKAESHRAPSSAAALEAERRRKVSYDPFPKVPAMPHTQDLYTGPRNSGPVVSPHGANANPYSYSWKPTPAATTPEPAPVPLDPTEFYGAGPANLRTPSPEDLYGSNPASKQPVPESGMDHHPKPLNPYFNAYLKSPSAGPGVLESTHFTKMNVTRSPSYGHSAGEPALYTIINSSGIQIGSYNCLKITDHTVQPNTVPADTHNNCPEYQKLFNSTAVVSEMHLNIVRENLGKHWKHFARKLGFQDPELDEIDHDYERDGLREKVYQMLQKWLMTEGSKGATVGKLAQALYTCHKIDLLNSFVRISQESETSNK